MDYNGNSILNLYSRLYQILRVGYKSSAPYYCPPDLFWSFAIHYFRDRRSNSNDRYENSRQLEAQAWLRDRLSNLMVSESNSSITDGNDILCKVKASSAVANRPWLVYLVLVAVETGKVDSRWLLYRTRVWWLISYKYLFIVIPPLLKSRMLNIHVLTPIAEPTVSHYV